MNTIEQAIFKLRTEIEIYADSKIDQAVRQRWDSLTKPRGSLGLLESWVVKLAQIQGSTMPAVDRRGMYVFCGDHGITAEGVSLYPSAVTREMAKNFLHGGAAINVLCRQFGIETRIVDAGIAGEKLDGVLDQRVGSGTRSFLRGPAMSRHDAEIAVNRGVELSDAAAKQFNLVGLGEMGIGNSTSASAILCVLTGAIPEQAAGKGAGLDQVGIQHKREVLNTAISLHNVDAADPLGVLSAFGGFEIAMMAGFLLGSVSRHLAIVIDGFISSAAFLIARAFHSTIGDYVFFSHQSAELGHRSMLQSIGETPMLDLQLCLGEGTGAALAMSLLTSATNLYREMATFSEAEVSDITNPK